MITKKHAKAILDAHKNETAYFDNSLYLKEFEDMLYYRLEFGWDETEVITAALILAGAKFKEE